ncbi:SIS domain-containing protein [Streptosporangium sp. NBC_01755]|uniref:D-sedoheptulose-7-phosphate isomerase n=1 Tax=unclassified Streptosporangium TaxID=2632669 RepID=UPI002DDBBB46|nr:MULTISPECIES: SIS domain-containing protein [unclassified Streptosporangium]WSA27012.1 SIS domain-containing protein [Streptosporangium sp. NBC_01810]WSD01576.1 SIS domain-containing protein [Streptosporangium sp. NBC_01755]
MSTLDGTPMEGTRGLYPFLDKYECDHEYDHDHDHPDRTGPGTAEAETEARRSALEKIGEIVRLRRRVGEESAAELSACAGEMAERFASGGRLFSFGNGGSSTDAQEVASAFLHPQHGPALPALCLTDDVAVVTALSNDVGFEVIFSRQLAALGRPGDIAVGLSTSGGSANVVRAFEEAARRDMLTVGLAGGGGGRLTELSELGVLAHLFVVPSSSVHRIQEAQTTLYHVLRELIRHALTPRTHDPG